ncbi:hypothetical protein LTR75_014029 [Friedmanniomyces endolithicus]|nr:hypothetical protein LTR75_014029 [Friedmanniomyces endolithicus]
MPLRVLVRKSLLDSASSESFSTTQATRYRKDEQRYARQHGNPQGSGVDHITPRQICAPFVSKVRRRHSSQSSLASVTAINAPTTVPPAHRDLHQRLLALQEEASTHINLSRVQLAARSLESEEPVIRVALLGLGANGAQAARKLARALLSDALSEEQAWEQELLATGQDGRNLLLRYGDSEDVVRQSPLVQTLHIPSLFLKRHKVEILVTTLSTAGNADRLSDAELEEAILVPSLTTPNSAGGRVGFVRYPVHKALVVAEGITGVVEYGRLPRFADKAELINAALSLPLRSATGTNSVEQTATSNVVDVDLATHAIELFRASNANGAQFSEEWQTSRLPALSQWISGHQEVPATEIHPAVRSLLNSVLLNASTSVSHAESSQTALAAKATIPDSKRAHLDALISHFSASWHRDLQTNLSAALDSRPWRRTAWWRLLWRIDDVAVSAADILRLDWLTEAEQTLAFISGRLAEAGLATADELREAGPATRYAIQGADRLEYSLSTWQPQQAAIIAAERPLHAAELWQADSLIARLKARAAWTPRSTRPGPAPSTSRDSRCCIPSSPLSTAARRRYCWRR